MTRRRAASAGVRGPLFWVGLMLLASGTVRIAIHAGAALAESAGAATAGVEAGCAPAASPEVLEALRAREAEIDSRELRITERLAELAAAEGEIRARLAELAEAEASLAELLRIADGAAEADLARLTGVYETMRPADAAELFAAMDPAFAAGFLGRMQTEAAAAILSELGPSAAYSISAILAGRHAGARPE